MPYAVLLFVYSIILPVKVLGCFEKIWHKCSLITIMVLLSDRYYHTCKLLIFVLSILQTIQVPDSSNELRTFQFSLSAVQGDPNGSFDAVCQTGSK